MSEVRFHKELPIDDGFALAHYRCQCFNGEYYDCGHEVWEARNGLSEVHCPKCKELEL